MKKILFVLAFLVALAGGFLFAKPSVKSTSASYCTTGEFYAYGCYITYQKCGTMTYQIDRYCPNPSRSHLR